MTIVVCKVAVNLIGPVVPCIDRAMSAEAVVDIHTSYVSVHPILVYSELGVEVVVVDSVADGRHSISMTDVPLEWVMTCECRV